MSDGPWTNLASSATVGLSTVPTMFVLITGDTDISAFAGANLFKVLRFSGQLNLIYNATSLVIPGGVSLPVTTDDVMFVATDESGNARVLVITPITPLTIDDIYTAMTMLEDAIGLQSDDLIPVYSVSDGVPKSVTNASLQLSIPDGTPTAPGWGFLADPLTGFARIAAKTLATLINGVVKLSLNNVGLFVTDSLLINAGSFTTNPNIRFVAHVGTNLNLIVRNNGRLELASCDDGVIGFQPLAIEAGTALKLNEASGGSVVAGSANALALNATSGFLYLPTCAGTPTGTPTGYANRAPMVIDTTNKRLWAYIAGAWRNIGTTT